MQGLELSRKYYELFGKKMINEFFPEYENRIAVGLAGPGSDCFGFDDVISRDHDFGAGFCLWLTDEDYEKIGFALSRKYLSLPDELDGIKKAEIPPYGITRYGVKRITDFYTPLIGSGEAPSYDEQWLSIPDYALASATNGDVFRDDLGIFSQIRNDLLYNMPEDVRLKKISARVIGMAQSGQYNFERCIKHKEYGAAAIALTEFVKETSALIYLLNGKFAPFYKWMLRGLKNLEMFSEMYDSLSFIITSAVNEETYSLISDTIENICHEFSEYFRNNYLSNAQSDFLEPHAYNIQNKIKNPDIRNMHIMEG